MSELPTWSMLAGSNQQSYPDGFIESGNQAGYNDSMREVMASIRRWYDDPEWLDITQQFPQGGSGTLFQVFGIDVRVYFNVGRRVRVVGDTTLDGHVTAVSFSGGNTDITVDFTLPTNAGFIFAHIGKALRNAAFRVPGNGVGDIPLNVAPGGALANTAYRTQSNTTGDIPVHSQTGPFKSGAYHDFEDHAFANKTGGDEAIISSPSAVAIAGLTNITIPGTPDGVKKYRVSILIAYFATSAVNDRSPFQIHVGTSGTVSDAVVLVAATAREAVGGARVVALSVPGFEITPAANTKVTVSIIPGNDITVSGTTPRTSFLYIERVA